jgi:hypothetical protein
LGETHFFHFQGRRISEGRNQHVAENKLDGFIPDLFFDPEIEAQCFSEILADF